MQVRGLRDENSADRGRPARLTSLGVLLDVVEGSVEAVLWFRDGLNLAEDGDARLPVAMLPERGKSARRARARGRGRRMNAEEPTG